MKEEQARVRGKEVILGISGLVIWFNWGILVFNNYVGDCGICFERYYHISLREFTRTFLLSWVIFYLVIWAGIVSYRGLKNDS